LKTHAEWTESVKQASLGSDKTAAAHALEQIALEIGDAEDRDWSAWALVQTLGLAATCFEEAGKPLEVERVLRSCLNATRTRLVEASRAHAEIAARLGALLFQQGSHEEAEQLGSQSLQALTAAPEPSFALEQFLAAWRKHEMEKKGPV
jgi:hypothetical protein